MRERGVHDMATMRHSPLPIYLFGFASMFLILIPVIIPYFESYELSMKEIYELNAFFGLSVALCEIPSGYLADLWGRKRALQLGSCIIGSSFSALYWLDSYWEFVIFEMSLGIGLSLVSGTDIAMLYDLFESSPAHLDSSEPSALSETSDLIEHFQPLEIRQHCSTRLQFKIPSRNRLKR